MLSRSGLVFACYPDPPRAHACRQVIRLLLDAGASTSAIDEDGQTALHHAAAESNEAALLVLAPSPECAELFVADSYQMTPFHLACENGHAAAVAHLLALCEQQTDETKVSKAKQMRRGSALFLAQKNGFEKVVGLIDGSKPLSSASEQQQQQEAAESGGASEGGGSGSGS